MFLLILVHSRLQFLRLVTTLVAVLPSLCLQAYLEAHLEEALEMTN